MDQIVRDRLKSVLLETFLLPDCEIDRNTKIYLDEQAEDLITSLTAAGLKVEIDDSL